MSIYNQIFACIKNNGLRNPSFIIDGAYLLQKQRRVYSKILGGKHLEFFINLKDDNSAEEETDVDGIALIKAKIANNPLNKLLSGYEYGDEAPTVLADANYNLVIIKSAVYSIGERLYKEKSVSNTLFTLGNYVSQVSDLAKLREAFAEKTLVDYKNIVCVSGANRFARNLIKRNKLYGVYPSCYVPVFLNYKYLPNPFENPDLAIKDTLMYRTAVEKGRFLESGSVSAYFLTHKEICQAMGMSRFARFNASIWYNMFIGLLKPMSTEFPNKATEVVMWIGDLAQPKGLQKAYNKNEIANLDDATRALIQGSEGYKISNTLQEFIYGEYNRIRMIGPTYIDEKRNITKENLYSIYEEASLKF